MDTKKYRAFAKTVELGSLTQAADELGYTQSGVSHIVAALEDELGLTLLTRTRSGARLTSEGERVMPYILELLRQEELLRSAAEELRGPAAGLIKISTFTSVATHWLPAMMKEFQKTYPRVDFRLYNGDYNDVNKWLEDGSVDLGFITLPTQLRCECIPLCDDKLMAVLPKGHPLTAAPVCRMEEVAREPFISLLESSDQDSRRALDMVGVKPNVKFTTKDDYAIIAMVSQGLGVSIMPELLLTGHDEGVEVRPTEPPVSRTIALALPLGKHTSPAARSFAGFVAEWVRKVL